MFSDKYRCSKFLIMHQTGIYIAIAVALIIVLLAVSYEKGWLDKILPASMKKNTFVGAYARTPRMQNCLALDPSHRGVHFNRCTWA